MLFSAFFVREAISLGREQGGRYKTVGDESDFTADIRHPTDGMKFIKGNSLRDFHKPQ